MLVAVWVCVCGRQGAAYAAEPAWCAALPACLPLRVLRTHPEGCFGCAALWAMLVSRRGAWAGSLDRSNSSYAPRACDPASAMGCHAHITSMLQLRLSFGYGIPILSA